MSTSSKSARRPAIFLDRDGVINAPPKRGSYITDPTNLHLIPEVAGAIRSFRERGYLVIVVTNQRCLALGLLTEEALMVIHKRLRFLLQQEGAEVDAIYFCPHDDDHACQCRKPKPGMLIRAAEEHGIDLRSSWMIGDSERDLIAGRAAGCRTILFATDGESVEHRIADKSICRWSELFHPSESPLF